MLGWLDHPSIVPFKQHLDPAVAQRFHEAAAARMIAYTKQADGTCFETFRRINVSAQKMGGDQVSTLNRPTELRS
jgi:trans-aconitate 2-methyltransferase